MAEMGANDRSTNVTLVAVADDWKESQFKLIFGMQCESPVILRLIGTVATLTQAHIMLCQSAREGVQFKKVGNI